MVEQAQQRTEPIISYEQVQQRLADFPILAFEAGDVVLHEDSSTNRLLILRRGVVDVVKDDVQLAQVSEPGAVFGEMSFILGRPHTAHVLAAGPSSFSVIDDVRSLLDADPEMARYLMVVMAKRLDAVNRLLIDARSVFLDADSRHGILDDIITRIGRALHISART